MVERVYRTHMGDIHYWVDIVNLQKVTLVLLPGLTADHRLFDKQQMGGGNNKALSFGRNRAKLNNPNGPKKITFDNVAGLKEEKEELAEIGVNVCIYANQLLRASYPAMRKCAERILEAGRAQEASKEYCMSIKEILTLI